MFPKGIFKFILFAKFIFKPKNFVIIDKAKLLNVLPFLTTSNPVDSEIFKIPFLVNNWGC